MRKCELKKAIEIEIFLLNVYVILKYLNAVKILSIRIKIYYQRRTCFYLF